MFCIETVYTIHYMFYIYRNSLPNRLYWLSTFLWSRSFEPWLPGELGPLPSGGGRSTAKPNPPGALRGLNNSIGNLT